MPDDDCKIDIRHFLSLQSPIANRNSKIVQAGGIAQLVERQLCKLEVRGSNPLASISKEMEAEMRTQFDRWGGERRVSKRSSKTGAKTPALDNPLASKACKAWRQYL